MPKTRNMIIDGYKKGTQLQMDEYGLFYIFNGRNPIDGIESYEILSEETSKDVVSTVGRGLLGSALFGLAGTSASLTGKENKIYTIRINYDDYDKWLEFNGVQDIVPECLPYWEAVKNNPETNPILDCCCIINPDWEEYMKRQEQLQQEIQQSPTQVTDISDIKSKLKELKCMYEEDLITEEEYNNKKRELLSKM